MENKKRLGYPDVIRGFAICLVMLGHIWDNPLCRFITSFHVPLFFVLSGHLIYLKDQQKTSEQDLKNIGMWILKRIKKLIFPYLIYSLMWLGVTSILEKSLVILKGNLVATVSLYGCGALWFLPAMFISESIFLLLKILSKKTGISNILPVATSILFFVGIGTLHFSLFDCEFVIAMLRSCVGLGFFAFGYYAIDWLLSVKIHKVVLITITLIDLVLSYCNGTVDLWGGQFNNLLLYIMTSLLGSVLCIKNIYLLGQAPAILLKLEKLIIYLGRNTLPIIGTHQLLIKFFRRLTGQQFYGYVQGFVLFLIVLFLEVIIIFSINKIKSYNVKMHKEKDK